MNHTRNLLMATALASLTLLAAAPAHASPTNCHDWYTNQNEPHSLHDARELANSAPDPDPDRAYIQGPAPP